MDCDEALKLLKSGPGGVADWNRRRREGKDIPALNKVKLIQANLRGVDFSGANLTKANLGRADLSQANFRKAKLRNADLRGANLTGTDIRDADLAHTQLIGADLSAANLSGANLVRANLNKARLITTNLSGANLSGATMKAATLLEVKLTKYANLTGCMVYGVSAWHLELDETTIQSNIVITDQRPNITVDDIEVAQFVYLLLNNERIRGVVDTITSKVVLILGRFTPERKAVLDALREELRRHNFTPIVFDFDKPANRNITETISMLAHMARFVIADITDAKSIAQELQRIVPDLPSVPVQPVILASQYEYGMFKDFLDYPWVLLPYRYVSSEDLISSLAKMIVRPTMDKSMEIKERRRLIEIELSSR